MIISQALLENGFSIAQVSAEDFPAFFSIKKECFKTYVDEYYGGWNDTV